MVLCCVETRKVLLIRTAFNLQLLNISPFLNRYLKLPVIVRVRSRSFSLVLFIWCCVLIIGRENMHPRLFQQKTHQVCLLCLPFNDSLRFMQINYYFFNLTRAARGSSQNRRLRLSQRNWWRLPGNLLFVISNDLRNQMVVQRQILYWFLAT